MAPSRILVLGTYNRKKSAELVALLAGTGLELRTLADLSTEAAVEEDGDSFAANARLKATHYAAKLRAWVLGEDSGLAVDALGGAPGIYSARYAGPHANDDQNNARLLAELGDTPLERRTAHYVCRLALSDPLGMIHAECGSKCHGRIRYKAAGSSGFGYDPLFEVIEYHRTFSELGETVKSALSHRARGVEQLLPLLLAIEDLGLPLTVQKKGTGVII